MKLRVEAGNLVLRARVLRDLFGASPYKAFSRIYRFLDGYWALRDTVRASTELPPAPKKIYGSLKYGISE